MCQPRDEPLPASTSTVTAAAQSQSSSAVKPEPGTSCAAQPSSVVNISSDDVVEVETLVSLDCPLTIERLVLPAQGKYCTHPQCFELGVGAGRGDMLWLSSIRCDLHAVHEVMTCCTEPSSLADTHYAVFRLVDLPACCWIMRHHRCSHSCSIARNRIYGSVPYVSSRCHSRYASCLSTVSRISCVSFTFTASIRYHSNFASTRRCQPFCPRSSPTSPRSSFRQMGPMWRCRRRLIDQVLYALHADNAACWCSW